MSRGRFGLQTLGKLSKRQSLMQSGPAGRFANIAHGVDTSFHYQTVLEAAPALGRIHFLNGVAAAITGVQAMFACANTLGADNSALSIDAVAGGAADGQYQPLTVGGSTTFQWDAGTDVDAIKLTSSDWMPLKAVEPLDPSQPGYPFHLRLSVPAANANLTVYNWTDMAGWETAANVGGRVWRTRSQAVLAASNGFRNNFTSTAFNGRVPPVIIEIITRDAAQPVNILVVGDSIPEGTGASIRNNGFWAKATRLCSTPKRPVGLVNLAINGASTSAFVKRVNAAVPVLKPHALVVPAYSVNSAGGGLGSPAAPMVANDPIVMAYNHALCRSVAQETDTLVVNELGQPTNPAQKALGASDAMRVALNSRFSAPPSPRSMTLDIATPVSGPVDANGQVSFAAGLTNDGVHSNDAGHDACVPNTVGVITRLQAMTS